MKEAGGKVITLSNFLANVYLGLLKPYSLRHDCEKQVTKLGTFNAKLFSTVFLFALMAKAVLYWNAVLEVEWESR